MSQHFFATKRQDQEIIVLLGFDRPLGHVFMVVTPEGKPDQPIYSNLLQAKPFDLTLDDYWSALNELGIEVPMSMFEEVALDQILGEGNRVVWHDAQGNMSAQRPQATM